jgi:hypothetical protein
MRRQEALTAVAAAAALALLAWLISFEGGAKIRAQLSAAAAAGDGAGPVTAGSPVRHGLVPEQWTPHVPARAHPGPHRMYRHPRSCSPVLTAPHQVAYDWLYSPPSEGSL